MMRHERLKNVIEEFKDRNILVVGDVMLDEFIRGKVDRISPEAPVPVINVQSVYLLPGGAANVAKNILTLGGNVYLAGVVGGDDNAERLKKVLKKSSIQSDYLIEEDDRPTTTKTRILAGSQQIARTDIEKTTPLKEKTRSQMNRILDELDNKYDAIIISDYDKGVIDNPLLTRLVRIANEKQIPVCVDPNITHFFDYVNVSVLTPNLRELEAVVGRRLRDSEVLDTVGREVLEKIVAGALLVTQGEEGMSLMEMSGHTTHIPTVAKQVYDVTGAGDTVISVMAMSLASGASFLEAAKISNAAAGVVVGKRGTATLDFNELLLMLEDLKTQ